MLKGLHILLTYQCPFECDHCFLYCGPGARGTFTAERLRDVLTQAASMDSVREVWFEGGEPFLYYPLLAYGLELAAGMGFETGVVTNAYWALGVEDAGLWLEPLRRRGLGGLTLSDDEYHFGPVEETPASRAAAAADRLGLPTEFICVDPPTVDHPETPRGEKGEPVVGGGVRFRGRAADRLARGLPQKPCRAFDECPDEDLADPGRVHLDPFGHVFVCQGISIGNFVERPLAAILGDYEPEKHPICGPLLRGGPAELVAAYDLDDPAGGVDACHVCFSARRRLMDRYPECLAPAQVYGREEE